VSRSANRELFVAGTARRPELREVLDRVAARAPISLRFGHDGPSPAAGPKDDWTMQSDHGAFHMHGIPFVYFGVEDHADYHEPSDTADRIDPAFFAQAAETILDAIDALDRWLPSARR
jgi:Zn-dependent M28 family amino/carboxypeptidase